jgi:hypothetical protein
MSAKCGLCQKAVYPNDAHLNLDSKLYHKGCAKCEDCKCQITLANFTKSGDLLLCKTHYFERFSVNGSYAGADKFKKSSSANSAPVVPVSVAPVSSSTPSRNERKYFSYFRNVIVVIQLNFNTECVACTALSEKAASVKDRLKAFGASVNNTNKCAVCTKSVYPNDPQLVLDSHKYHKGCAKCSDCKCQIDTSNFTRDGTTLYCTTHYVKRFREQGKFVGEEKFSRKRGETNADHLAGHTALKSSAPPAPPSNDEEAAAKQKAEEEAAAKHKAEEEEAAAKQKAEEEEAAAKQKAEEEEAAAKQKAEEEEAAAKQKAEEEEAAAKQKAEEEEEAAAKQKAEEEEAAAKQKAEEEEAAAKQKAEEEEAAAKEQVEEEEAAAKEQVEEEEAAAKEQVEEDTTSNDNVEVTTADDVEDESV